MSIVGPLAASEVPLVAATPGEGAGAHGNAADKAGPQAPW